MTGLALPLALIPLPLLINVSLKAILNLKSNVLTNKQKVTLWIFVLAFLVMILGFIPWDDLGIKFFLNKTGFLTGVPFGRWWFSQGTLWFLIVTIFICIINRFSEKETINTIIEGVSDMIGVVLIIALVNGVSVLVSETYLDNYIMYNFSELLKGLPSLLYTVAFAPSATPNSSFMVTVMVSSLSPAFVSTNAALPSVLPAIQSICLELTVIVPSLSQGHMSFSL